MRRLRANVQVWAEGGPRQRGDGETGLWGNEVGWVGFVCGFGADHYIFVNRAARMFGKRLSFSAFSPNRQFADFFGNIHSIRKILHLFFCFSDYTREALSTGRKTVDQLR